MGRYYSGDIEGKFWFALQASNAASRFGGEESMPEYIDYYFSEDHLDSINEEIRFIETTLGDNKKVIEDFFKDKISYSDTELESLGITSPMLSEYADLLLGIKIRDCVVENNWCSFQAEL